MLSRQTGITRTIRDDPPIRKQVDVGVCPLCGDLVVKYGDTFLPHYPHGEKCHIGEYVVGRGYTIRCPVCHEDATLSSSTGRVYKHSTYVEELDEEFDCPLSGNTLDDVDECNEVAAEMVADCERGNKRGWFW